MTPGRKRALELLGMQRTVVLEAAARVEAWEKICEVECSVGALRSLEDARETLSKCLGTLDLADRAAHPNDGTSH